MAAGVRIGNIFAWSVASIEGLNADWVRSRGMEGDMISRGNGEKFECGANEEGCTPANKAVHLGESTCRINSRFEMSDATETNWTRVVCGVTVPATEDVRGSSVRRCLSEDRKRVLNRPGADTTAKVPGSTAVGELIKQSAWLLVLLAPVAADNSTPVIIDELTSVTDISLTLDDGC